jgi:hypothetical protein
MGPLHIDIQGPELAKAQRFRHPGRQESVLTTKLVELYVRRRHKKGVLLAAPLFIISLSSDKLGQTVSPRVDREIGRNPFSLGAGQSGTYSRGTGR